MTDEEIKKALECCKNGNPCSSCPYNGKCTDEDFNDNYLIKDVISLITRQKAEIERLNIEIKSMRSAANSYKIQYEKCAKEDVVDINVGKIAELQGRSERLSDEIERVLQNLQQPKTNFEMIKKKVAEVTLPRFVRWLMYNMHCEKCPGQKYCNDMACDEAILKWLTSEVENDG